jgi:hypothetical protein
MTDSPNGTEALESVCYVGLPLSVQTTAVGTRCEGNNMTLKDYTATKWKRVAALQTELRGQESVNFNDLYFYGEELLGSADALMFIRRTQKLQVEEEKGRFWIPVCPQWAVDYANLANGNYEDVSVKSRLSINPPCTMSPEKLRENMEAAGATGGKHIFYITHETSSGSVKIGWSSSSKGAQERRVKKQARARIMNRNAQVVGLSAIPVESATVARGLEHDFEATFGNLSLRRPKDQSKRWGQEFYQPDQRILDLAKLLGKKYPFPE